MPFVNYEDFISGLGIGSEAYQQLVERMRDRTEALKQHKVVLTSNPCKDMLPDSFWATYWDRAKKREEFQGEIEINVWE